MRGAVEQRPERSEVVGCVDIGGRACQAERVACAKALRWAPAWFAPEAARQSVQLWQQGETYN